jgi:hypothetical protein
MNTDYDSYPEIKVLPKYLIKSKFDLFKYFGAKNANQLENNVYDDTRCAYIRTTNKDFIIGTILSSDCEEFEKHFKFPVKPYEIDEWIEILKAYSDKSI